MMSARANCFMLFIQDIPWAFCFALDNAGNSIAAKMAMMAMTTRSSMSVKAGFCDAKAALRACEFMWIRQTFSHEPRKKQLV